MEKHIPIIASIRIGFGVLELLGAIFLSIILVGIGMITNDRTAMLVLTMVAVVTSLFLLVFAIPNIIGGVGLLRYRSWARYLVLVISVISLLNVPFGTAIGACSIWVLVQDETIGLYTKPAQTIQDNTSK